MTNKENQTHITELPSILYSSACIEEFSFRHDLSMRFVNEEEQNSIAINSFNDIRVEQHNDRKRNSYDLAALELKRCTSFEEILMENHRNVLADSMEEYFVKINHEIIQKSNRDERVQKNSQLNQFISIKSQIELIIMNNDKIQQTAKNRLITRFDDNPDELKIIIQMMSLCPKGLKFETIYLISLTFEQCDDIIQHFRRRRLSKQLKQKSNRLAHQMLKHRCLEYLFLSQNSKQIGKHFQALIQKWVITLFLMKIGVFQNQLRSKSIDDCLKSQIFNKIDLNDLLNQHLLHSNKMHKNNNDIKQQTTSK